MAGDLTEQLVINRSGALNTPERRAAFAACVDAPEVATAVSAAAGVEVKPLATRLMRANSPAQAAVQEVVAHRMTADLPAVAPLAGSTVRVAYAGADPIKAAIVETITASCARAGVTIEDISAGFDAASVRTSPVAEQEGSLIGTAVSPGVDVLIQTMDPTLEFGASDAPAGDIGALRGVEDSLWQDVPTVPLSATPRTFIVNKRVGNVVIGTTLSGIGWNLDRWQMQ